MKPVNQPHQLSHHDKKLGTFTNMNIVAEAKRSNCWLYNKLSHTWYTPEEFHEKYANHTDTNINLRSLLENIVIMDPIAGIKAYHKKLEDQLHLLEKSNQELREKGESFTRKVISYYQQKRK
ncbi:hypothetical protein [Pedobacter agri]|uniref:hypothetical protein n=1 Tax=Pedobacter agri TaxID=454586 RepID=UPI00292F3F6A|nr:hypothetical protein [Pedobacter agri]